MYGTLISGIVSIALFVLVCAYKAGKSVFG